MNMRKRCPGAVREFGKCAIVFCLSVVVAMGSLLIAAFAPQDKISENSIVIKTEISLALIEDEGIINANLTGIVPWKLDSMSFHKIIETTEDGKEFEESGDAY